VIEVLKSITLTTDVELAMKQLRQCLSHSFKTTHQTCTQLIVVEILTLFFSSYFGYFY